MPKHSPVLHNSTENAGGEYVAAIPACRQVYLKCLSGNLDAFLLELFETGCELTSAFFQWFKQVILFRVIIVNPEYLIT